MSEDNAKPDRPDGISAQPGWFGAYRDSVGSGFIMAIHANWPAYPCEPGGGHALFDLAQFPPGTRFVPLRDIDRCVLFGAYNYDPKKPGRPKEPMSRDAFQLAIWHEDLLTLQKDGLISGVTPICEREFELRRRAELGWPTEHLYSKRDDGTMERTLFPPLPPAPTEDDLWDDPYRYPAFDDDTDGTEGAITITSTGWDVVTQRSAEHLAVPDSMPDLGKLLDSELYDSAMREIGIAVEEELRLIVGNDDGFGQRLVGEFITHLDEELFVYNTMLKIFRLRLRTFFKFTRNPHAHRKINLDRPQALALSANALELLRDIQQFRRSDEATR